MRNKSIKIALMTAFALAISGCVGQPKPLYNYADYSDKYYASKVNTGEESTLALQASMQEAIENAAKSRSGRVAPGMYANLGYLYLKSGKTKEAIALFKQEKELYPESAHFMDKMIQKVEASQEKK